MMKWNQVRIFSVLLIAGLTCAMAQAASLNSSDLPTDSNWYVHVNLELLRNSNVGRQFVLETLDEALDEIQSELNIDIRNEIEGITVFGGQLPVKGDRMSDGAVILHGPINEDTRAALMPELERKGAKVSTSYVNGLAFYTIENEDDGLRYEDAAGQMREAHWDNSEVIYFSFGNTQTLITSNLEMMQTFLSANGYLGGFERVDADALLVLQADRALLQGGANTSVEINEDWDSSVLKNVDAVAVVVAEDNDGVQIDAQLTANSAEVAMSVRNIVEGLVALKALSDSDGAMGDVLRNVRFQNEGSVLHVSVPVSAVQIESLKDL
jgi:hypothetical protein